MRTAITLDGRWTDDPWGKTNLIDKWFPSGKLVQIA